jgi:hypothetical protein
VNAQDLDLLLRLRLTVARFGEMDGAKWWNTRGQLGSLGATALRRGFPRTHHFAQARSVFAVAEQRCRELSDQPKAVTLWRLTDEIEEEFDARWEFWLDQAPEWAAFFEGLQRLGTTDLVEALAARNLVDDPEVQIFSRLKRSADGRAVLLSSAFSGSSQDLRLLALGFGRGEVGAPAIPYMRKVDA